MDGLKARLSFDAVAYDYDDEYLSIDTDTHTININNVSRLFGVQYDGNSKLIKFRVRNKLSDIQKMQDSIVYINWIDSRGVKGQSIAINKTINNDTCEFSWKVPFDALKNSGVLHFAVSAVMTKNSSSVIDQRWSTQIASVITPDGIYIKSYTPSSEEEDRIAQIYNELSNMINKQNDNLQSQVNSLKEDLGAIVDIDEAGFKPGQNCFNPNDPGIEKGYLSRQGTINPNDTYSTSSYIDVTNCRYIAFYRKKTNDTIVEVSPFACFFDVEKKYLADSYSNSKQIVVVPTGAKYMRFSAEILSSSPFDYYMAIVSNSETVSSPNALIPYSEPAKRSVKLKQDSNIRENTEKIAQIQKNVSRIFHCGKSRDYKTLREVVEEAMKYPHSVVYLDAEVFDLVQEFGEDYLNNFVSSNNEMCGIFLGNGITIIGTSGTKIVFNYNGTNEQIHQYFSPFNAGRSSALKDDAIGYTLENLLVESTNCRYSVHDERGSDDTPYTNRYIGCTFIHDSSKCSWGAHQAIGGGLGVHGTILIENCYAVSTGYGQTISYHNCTSKTKTTKSEVMIKDSFLSGRAHCANYGTSTEKSRMIVCNCSLSQAPTLEKVITADRADNMELITWNNEIRTS